MTYLAELEAEVTRLRKLCSETTDKLAVLASHVAEDKRNDIVTIIAKLHRAAHGNPFPLESDRNQDVLQTPESPGSTSGGT